MLFKKKKSNSLFREVDDSREVVYDFRRRSHELFENYRPVSYRTSPEYDLNQIRKSVIETLVDLFKSGSIDSGNKDCLIEQILGPIRQELKELDIQRVYHMDFYHRYKIRRTTDYKDLECMLNHYEDRRNELLIEHAATAKQYEEYKNKELEKEKLKRNARLHRKENFKRNSQFNKKENMEVLAYDK